MKAAIKICDEFGKKEGKLNTYSFLLLESNDDLDTFSKIYPNLIANINAKAWLGFLSQNIRDTFGSYLAHEVHSIKAETKLLNWRLSRIETPIDLILFANISDKIILDKLLSISKILDKNEIVRLNKDGGLTNINSLDEFDAVFNVDEKEVSTFILLGEFIDEDLKINTESIIIENDNILSEEFEQKLYKVINKNSVSTLFNFKLKTSSFKDEDFLKLFQNGIKNGLRNICFNTTGQDYHNISNLYSLLKVLEKNNENIKIKVYFSTNDKKVQELFSGENYILL